MTSIIIERGRATAVRCTDAQGRSRRVAARRSVVLAAGALRAPQLLMLSGIGPAGHLREHGLDVIRDLPAVGANLQDHPVVTPTWPVIDGGPMWSGAVTDADAYRFLRRGPLASFAQAGAIVRTRDDLPGPNIQLTLALIGADRGGRVLEEAVRCAVAVIHLAPVSRGEVRLATADPAAAPLVDPKYLAARADHEDLIEALRLVRRLFQTAPLKAATGGEALDPRAWDNEALDAWLQDSCGSGFHPVGTCRMGTDPGAVVSSATMEVNGIPGLHVAGASVMPSIPRANTHAPTIMIAEHAARLMRKAVVGEGRAPEPIPRTG